jgi:hypothetical protein
MIQRAVKRERLGGEFKVSLRIPGFLFIVLLSAFFCM